MKPNKTAKEDYSKIIGQIDSLKTNITQLITINHDTCRTVRITDPKKTKSPICSRTKGSRNDRKSVKKNISQSKVSNNKTESSQSALPNKLWEKLIQVERTNQQIKSSHLVLEEMLRVEREKRIHLERELRAAAHDKKSVAVQTAVEPNRSSCKELTPQKTEGQRRKQSKIRDQGDVESFLLGDCDEYIFSSPKKRNMAEIQLMQLIQKISKGAPADRLDDLKSRFFQAAKRFIRR